MAAASRNATPARSLRSGIRRVSGSTRLFFKAHPEFDGEVQATILAEGQVLLSAKATRKVRAKKPESLDPVMASFLGFLEEQMREHPDRIRPLDARLLDEIGALVKGVAIE